jgi:integrase/recombinase XerD
MKMKTIETQLRLFKDYLKKHSYSWQAVQGYGYTIQSFLLENPSADTFGYTQVLGYMDKLSQTSLHVTSLVTKLNAIKKYFDFLIEKGKREDHPCKRLYLKSKSRRQVIENDLFTSLELETLLKTQSRFTGLRTKHQVVISLFIYQGLLPGEITALKLKSIDLEGGTVFVNGGKLLSSRRLEIHSKQAEIFEKYLSQDRKELLKSKKSDFFIINLLGNNDKPDAVVNSIETLKGLFPDRNLTAKTIRDSVISNLINERRKPIEQVQLFAGHRWICSTQRYYQSSAEDEREILRLFHPLG